MNAHRHAISIVFLSIIMVSPQSAIAGTFYVDDSNTAGPHNGMQWQSSFQYLQDALDVSMPGDTILVAQGIYYPDDDGGFNVPTHVPNSRSESFKVKANVILKGGYIGFDHASPDIRDAEAFITILSGDLLQNDAPGFVGFDENSYHVLDLSQTDEMTHIEGFTITHGRAEGASFSLNGFGAGVFIDVFAPSGFTARAKISDCVIAENWAQRSGGGIYVKKAGETGPIFNDCKIRDNRADGDGTVRGGGAGACADFSAVSFFNCVFTNNTLTTIAEDRVGGAILGVSSGVGAQDFLIDNCTFTDNVAGLGGAIYAYEGRLEGRKCAFDGNEAQSGAGGAICLAEDWSFQTRVESLLVGCRFTDNRAIGDGMTAPNPDNQGLGGGAIYVGWIEGRELEGASIVPDVAIINCRFLGNQATNGARGGAIHWETGGPKDPLRLTNCLFVNNLSEGSAQVAARGGALYSYLAALANPPLLFFDVEVTNCTIVENTGTGTNAEGGGLFFDVISRAKVANSILWNNTDSSGTGSAAQLSATDPGAQAVSYCDIEGGFVGTGNISDDPLFVNPAYGIYRLKTTSLASDAADFGELPPDNADVDNDHDVGEIIPLDLDGLPRAAENPDREPNTGVGSPNNLDMGAFEVIGPRVPAQVSPPPIYNSFIPDPSCYYTGSIAANPCGNDCLCSPTSGGFGWPCDPCEPSPPGNWPVFSQLFYSDKRSSTCQDPTADFSDLPLLDLPNGLANDPLNQAPDYKISIAPMKGLDRIREVPLECSPDRWPVDAAARYTFSISGQPIASDCEGAIFFVTAEYNSALFDVKIHGRMRNGQDYQCQTDSLLAYRPRLIVASEVFTPNDLRYPDFITDPQYVRVVMKPGRNPRDAGNESVQLRVHSFNWGGETPTGTNPCNLSNCDEGFEFQLEEAVSVQVFTLEVPPSWCQDAPPLAEGDALPISTLNNAQRRSAEFDAVGATTINDVTAELPNLRAGHTRFWTGLTLEQSLGVDAFLHTRYDCNEFVMVNLFGVACAVSAPGVAGDEDLPGWRSSLAGTQLTVHDPCESFDYVYEEVALTTTGTAFKLIEVRRNGTWVRSYGYASGLLTGDLVSQVDSNGNQITYSLTSYDSVTLLTVTAEDTAGGVRSVSSQFTTDGTLESARWNNGGPARQYKYIIDSDPSIDGRLEEIRDPNGNVLLHYEYDDRGRVIEVSRGSGPTFQLINRQTYIKPPGPGTGEMMEDSFMVSQCFVDGTFYQAVVYTFDEFNRITQKQDFHELQDMALPDPLGTVPAFSGSSSTTTTKYREEGLGVIVGGAAGHFTVEKVHDELAVSDYAIFDQNFNVIMTFMGIPDLDAVDGSVVNRMDFHNQLFANVWQTTREIDVARDGATTAMEYDPTSGFLISRTMPEISATNNGSGEIIQGEFQSFTYDPVNRKRVDSESRNDGQDNTINITNTFDTYDYPAGRTEVGPCGSLTTLTEYNAFGQLVEQTDADGFVTARTYADGSGLLSGQHTFESGDTGPVLQQTRYEYYDSGQSRGRIERIRIADHVGPFTLDAPDSWQDTTFDYDVYGRVVAKTTTHTAFAQDSYLWIYAYDSQDRVKQITYPDGMWVRNLREGRGLLVNEFVGYGGDPAGGAGGTIELTNTYTYDNNGNLVDRLNQTAANLPDHSSYTYDIYHRRESQTDFANGSADYDIITQLRYNSGKDVTKRYVEEGLSGPVREEVRFKIDELGRVWTETSMENPSVGSDPTRDRIITTTFDIRGNELETRTTDTVIGDAVTARTYTCFDFPDTRTDILTDTVTGVTDYDTDNRGNVTSITDPVLNSTIHEYDALGQRIKSTFTEFDGRLEFKLRTESVYTSREQIAGQTHYDPITDVALDQQRWEYDTLGFQSRIARMADPAATGPISTSVDHVTYATFDGLGRTLTRTTYADGSARTTTWQYDEIGRLQDVTHPVANNSDNYLYYPNSTRLQTRTITDEIGSRIMTRVFDAFGRITSDTFEAIAPAAPVTTLFEYDASDRLVRETDPLAIVTLKGYDGIGQLRSVQEDSGGADQRTVFFTYTQKGDPLTVTADDGEGPQVTVYSHDRGGRRLRIDHPSDAQTPATSVQFTYDNAGRMQTRTAEDGFVTYYRRDWSGRALQKQQSDSQGPILEEFSYDRLGRMTAAGVGPLDTSAYKTTMLYGDGTDVDGNSTVDPAYSDMPVSVTQTVSGVAKTFTHAYNTAGELETLTYPSDADTSLAYFRDGLGHVTGINNNSNPLVSYEYAGREPTLRRIRTSSGLGEVWVETSWDRPDQLRRPCGITNRVSIDGTPSDLLTYTNVYDAAGNLDEQTTSNSPIENGANDLQYDRLHRLDRIDYADATTESWDLDDLGNWVTHTKRDTTAKVYTDNILNQYSAITGQNSAPLHDAKGNLVRNENSYGFIYDFENRLTHVFNDSSPSNGQFDAGETVYAEYVVDALGRRVQFAADGETSYRFYDSSDVLLAEYDGADTDSPSQVYINGATYLDEKVMARNKAGQEAYYLLKDLYTVPAIVNPDGAYIRAYAYTGYGLPTEVDILVETCVRGDVNGDGFCNDDDIAPFSQVLSGADTDPVNSCASDIDGDGDVDSTDLDLITRCIKLETCDNVCASGDLNADGTVDDVDLEMLTSIIVTGIGQPEEICAADVNRDGVINEQDIQAFTNCWTGGPPACPAPPGGIVKQIYNPFLFTGQRLDRHDANKLALYDYKARAFDPTNGRFQQRDPVEFADSYDLYEYVKSRPSMETDPTGQFSILGISVTTAIRKGLWALNVGLNVRAAVDIARQLRSGVAVHQVLLGIVIDVAADRIGGRLLEKALDTVGAFAKSFFRKLDSVCCFVAGTRVMTPEGPVPIECLMPGDLVITRDQYKPNGKLTVRPVSQVFTRVAPVILWISFANGEVLGTTPGHLVWSNENGWVHAADLEVGETFLCHDGSDIPIIAIHLDWDSATTYNLSVDETATYFVGGFWVHNNSCRRRIFDAHHVFPKFLGGNLDGFLVGLTPALHTEFHSDLLAALRERGLTRPGNGSAREWADLLDTGDYTAKMLDALKEVSRAYDQRLGGDVITTALLEQLKAQGF